MLMVVAFVIMTVVTMAFMILFRAVALRVMAFVDLRPFRRFRLGIVCEGIGRTQRFAFRARELRR